jgi:hypothetical protein
MEVFALNGAVVCAQQTGWLNSTESCPSALMRLDGVPFVE